MKRQCRNCAMFTPQVYKGKPQIVGRCFHISFYKSGFGKADAETGEYTTLDVDRGSERVSPEYATKTHGQGYFYSDLIDIKLQSRVCAHHRSPLAYAKDTLEFYKDDWRQHPDLPETLKQWFEQGMPLVDKHYPKLGRLNLFDYDAKDAPDEVIEAYDPCGLCEHFETEVDPGTGAPLPFRGFCNKSRATENSLFSINHDEERQRTYTFLSCHDYTPTKRWLKEEPREIPQRLLLFVEMNPLDLSFQQIRQILRFPLVSREAALDAVGLEEMADLDLVALLRERHADIDFNQFYADFHLQPVADYFAKGLRNESKHHKAFWAPFMPYKQADDALFNDPTFARVETVESDTTDLHDLISDLPIPQTAPPPVTPSDSSNADSSALRESTTTISTQTTEPENPAP